MTEAFRLNERTTLMRSLLARKAVVVALVVAALTALLGVRLYIEPRLYWRDLWMLVGFLAFPGTVFWLIAYAPLSARIFAAGFVLGAALEFASLGYFVKHNLLRSTPAVGVPEGWYPLAVPIERLFITRGFQTIADAPVAPIFLGIGLSGILTGSTVLLVWACLSWGPAKSRGADHTT